MRIKDINIIKEFEGLRLEAYFPTKDDRLNGTWTIGYGHTNGVKGGDVITISEAEDFLREDIVWVESAIRRLVKVGLTQNQSDALSSLVYNIGETQFASSTLLRKLNVGDYEGAANEFPKWRKDGGEVIQGLVNRRAAEMALFLKDDSVERIDPKPDDIRTLKPMVTSKELLAGSGALLTGGAAVIGSLTTIPQIILSTGLTIALLSFGGFILWNRVVARKRGER